MLVAVNTRLLLKDKLEGIGWFTYETLKRITKNHTENKFIFLFDRPFSDDFIFSNNIIPLVIGPQTRHPFLWWWWLEKSIPKIFQKYKPDLFLSPDGFLSLRSSLKQIPVIHDLNFEYYPQDVPFIARRYYKKYFPLFAKKAFRIITVSEYSKQDISGCYGIAPEKIDVVYNGANECFASVSEEEKKKTKSKYTKGADYFLFTGALHPRKNVARLLAAFDEFKKSFSSDIKLLIVGEKMWKTMDIEKTFSVMKFHNDVIFTGRLQQEELKVVTASALALVFVPYFEGFGIPIVEAMNCDVPVITSNVTSMPEIAGDAALLVDPFSVESIKNGMIKIYKEENLRKQLVSNGRIHRQKFSWDKTAEKLWRCIEKVLQMS